MRRVPWIFGVHALLDVTHRRRGVVHGTTLHSLTVIRAVRIDVDVRRHLRGTEASVDVT